MSTTKESRSFEELISRNYTNLQRIWLRTTSGYGMQFDETMRLDILGDALLPLLQNPEAKTAESLRQALLLLDEGPLPCSRTARLARGMIATWASSRMRDAIRNHKYEVLFRNALGSGMDDDTVDYDYSGRFAGFQERAARMDPADMGVHNVDELQINEHEVRRFARFLVKRLQSAPDRLRRSVGATLARLTGVKLRELATMYQCYESTVMHWQAGTHLWVVEAVEVWENEHRYQEISNEMVYNALTVAGVQIAGFMDVRSG